MNTPSSALAPVSLDEARHQRQETAFIDTWVRRTVRRYRVSADQLQELRLAGRLGGVQGQREWQALPAEKRTEENRRILVGRKVKDEVWTAWQQMRKRPKGKRAAALEAAHATTRIDYDGQTLRQRLMDMRAHVNHELYAGLLHGSLGLESSEDLYLEREQQKLDRDRVQFALARLESDDDRVLAHELLIEGRSLTEACATIGIFEKSKRTRARKRLFKQLRQHALVFASSRAARLPSSDGDGDALA